jgi:hypothetical protein
LKPQADFKKAQFQRVAGRHEKETRRPVFQARIEAKILSRAPGCAKHWPQTDEEHAEKI